jgi:integrase
MSHQKPVRWEEVEKLRSAGGGILREPGGVVITVGKFRTTVARQVDRVTNGKRQCTRVVVGHATDQITLDALKEDVRRVSAPSTNKATPTWRVLVDLYKLYKCSTRSPRSAESYDYLVKQEPPWIDRPVEQTNFFEVAQWFEKRSKEAPRASDLALQCSRVLWEWAEGAYPDRLKGRPFHNLRANGPGNSTPPVPAKALPKWFAVIDKEHEPRRSYHLLSIRTGIRRRELAVAKWSDYDDEQGILFIGKPKMGEAFSVPVSRQAREVLAALPRYSDHIFFAPKAKSQHIESIHVKALPRRYVGHSLRATFSSVAEELGIDATIRRLLIGHRVQRSALDRYTKREYLIEAMREAAQRISDELDRKALDKG